MKDTSHGDNRPTYKCPLQACDVRDKAKLEACRARRLEWLHLLETNEEHSITSQLGALLWQDAAFHPLRNAERCFWRPTPNDYLTAVG
jgi:hypothetical protein